MILKFFVLILMKDLVMNFITCWTTKESIDEIKKYDIAFINGEKEIKNFIIKSNL